ncbi:MAG: YafY family transcriptional regulator [Gammaproteobacteria bacterium]|nr:YafY family transcriptional regulator [Gammaproteobacteria bacterium]
MRTERLFKLGQYLRRQRQAVTAEQLAAQFGVSTRTIYRDIQLLSDAGVSIKGEAGVGYIISRDAYLPPIMLNDNEIEAVALGLAMARQATDAQFARSATSAYEKVCATLPKYMLEQVAQISTYTTTPHTPPKDHTHFSDLRESIKQKQIIEIHYCDENGMASQRKLQPIALIFASPVWMLVGWCQLRSDFRHFRLDRIKQLHCTEVQFTTTNDTSLAAYLQQETACQAV